MRRKKGVFWGFPGFGDLGGGRGGVWLKPGKLPKKGVNCRKRGDFLAFGEN